METNFVAGKVSETLDLGLDTVSEYLLKDLHQMKEGDTIKRSNVYKLSRRTKPTPEAEARAVLGR